MLQQLARWGLPVSDLIATVRGLDGMTKYYAQMAARRAHTVGVLWAAVRREADDGPRGPRGGLGIQVATDGRSKYMLEQGIQVKSTLAQQDISPAQKAVLAPDRTEIAWILL